MFLITILWLLSPSPQLIIPFSIFWIKTNSQSFNYIGKSLRSSASEMYEFTKPLLLKMWSADQQRQSSPRPYYWCTTTRATPDLMNQKKVSVRMTTNLSVAKHKRQQNESFNMRDNNYQPRTIYPAKISFKNEGQVKIFAKNSYQNLPPTHTH